MRTIIGKIIAIVGWVMILAMVVYWFWSIHPSIGVLVLGTILAIFGSNLADEL